MTSRSPARLFLRGFLGPVAALTGLMAPPPGAAASLPVTAWEQVVSDRQPNQPGDPIALRRLPDGSVMVVFGPQVIRYDKDGAILSNASVSAAGAAAVAIDPFGSIAVASQRTRGLNSEQDFSVMKFDGLTGRAMWNDRVWYSMGPFTKVVAASFNQRGDLFIISAFSGSSNGFGWATICFEGRTGAVRWGPVRYLSMGQASAVGAGQPFDLTVDATGNVLVTGYVGTETTPLLATIRYDGLTGATLWGPATLDVSLPPHPTICGICIDPTVSLKVALDRTGGMFIATASYKYDNLGNLADPKWLLVKLDLSSGRRLWGPVSTSTILLPLSMAVDGNGDLVVATSGSGSSVLTKWRGSTGERLWGPVSFEYGITTMEFDGRGDLFVTGTLIPDPFTRHEARSSKFEGATGRQVWESGTGSAADSWDSKWLAVDPNGNVSVLAFNGTHFQLGIVGYSGFDGANRFGPAPIQPGSSTSRPFTVLMTSREESIVVTLSGLPSSYYGKFETFVRKFAKDGSLIWGPFVFHGSDPPDGIVPMAAALDSNEDVVVAGEGRFSYVEKISGTTGSLVWGPIQLEYNWAGSTHLAIDRSGDVFVVVRSSKGWVLRKFSGSTGSPIWGPVSYETSEGVQSSALAVDAAGDVFIAGSSHVGHPIWMTFKYSGSSGEPIWGPVSLDGFSGYTSPAHIAIDGKGDAIVMGSLSTRTGDSCATIKYSGGSGRTIWGPSLLPIGLGRPQQLALDSAGDIFVSAEKAEDGVNNGAVIVKYAGSTGEPLWGPVDYHLNGFEPVAIAVDGPGDVDLAAPQSNGIDTDWFLAKLSGASGSQIWTDSFDSGFTDAPVAVAARGGGFVVVGSAGQQSRIARYTSGLTIQSLPEEFSRARCGETYRSELAASNASLPVSWSIVEGEAPPGITLDPSGTLSGTPEQQGSFTFVAEARDSSGATARRTLAIDVLDATPLLEVQAARNNTCLYGGYTLFLPESHASYVWGPGGETTSVIDVCPLQPTVYSVVVSDDAGCRRRGSIELSAYRIASPPREPVIPPGRRTPSPRIAPRLR